MKHKRCIAFCQSQDFPELLMPCTGIRERDYRGVRMPFCKEHTRAYRELLVGIFNEARNVEAKKAN